MKKIKLLAAVGMASALMGITAYAGGWQQDTFGWWYQNDNGSYPKDCWQWIDGDNDGTAECYYFDSQGYCLINGITPDGYTVNGNGAWVVDGKVQTNMHQEQAEKERFYSKEEACSMALQYFNSQYPDSNGRNVIFIEETTMKAENYLFIVRWQMSDEEAERRLASGRDVAANIYNGTVVFNKRTGEMRIEW